MPNSLNDQVIRSAKSGVLWDPSLKGFGVRVGARFKTFIVLVASGRRKRIGRYPLISLADARTVAKKILAEKTLGRVVPTHTAFEEAKKLFLEDCATRLRPSTLRVYRDQLKLFDFGRRSVGDVTDKDIARALKYLTPSQKEHTFRVGRTFFTWCVHEHYVDRSPMESMKTPPQGKSRERVLTDDELRLVYKASAKPKSQLHRLVWLLIRTGQRVGEMRHLKWGYIASQAGLARITLPGEITKNKRPHSFPISEDTYKTIQTFPQMGEYVFPSVRTHCYAPPFSRSIVPR